MTGRDDGETKRQVARRERRDAGDSSEKLAHDLMGLQPSSLAKLGLDEDLLEVIIKARAVTALVARRRAERTVAGALRRIDLAALAARLENIRITGVGDPRRLHQAERWRTRLLDEDDAPAAFRASFRTASHQALPRLVEEARAERTTGKPPGAGRALFRHINAVLDDAATEAALADDAKAEAEADANDPD